MKTKILLFIFFAIPFICRAQQPKEYTEWIQKAYTFYQAKQYQEAGDAYTHAFATLGGKGAPDDRYNAACVWSLAGKKDSAFYHLDRLATKAKFSDISHMTVDPDLNNLHTDKRWQPLCALVTANKEKEEEHLNKPIVAILDTVMQNDQASRMQIDEVQKKYGWDSKEVKDLWATINTNDSIDLIKVEKILDKYGWMGPDEIGYNGNTALFLVIQHSDIKVQEKYLPMMREAVKNNKAQPGSLALLEDRVALREGRKQIYGSQVHGDPNGHPWVSPLEDPDNVDKRRAEVGLQPLAEYLANWNIKWDVEEYKKQLPEIMKKEKGE